MLCLVPRDLADHLHDPLREHFRDRPEVEVIVERREGGERRGGADRRRRALRPAGQEERRRPRKLAERRFSERRAPRNEAQPPPLPDWARPFAGRLSFAVRFEPLVLEREDLDTADLVERVRAGERSSFDALYQRYFHRVYGYLRTVAADPHEAEELTQQVFVRTLESLSRHRVRGESFRAWLVAAARDEAVDSLRHRRAIGPKAVSGPGRTAGSGRESSTFAWMERRASRRFERLPEDQREVLVLRELLELSVGETASALRLSEPDVTSLQYRALGSVRLPAPCPRG